MIDWEAMDSIEDDLLEAPVGDLSPKPVGEAVSRGTVAVEHWRRNLERFPAGHIGHEYAKAALERLSRFDRKGELEA